MIPPIPALLILAPNPVGALQAPPSPAPLPSELPGEAEYRLARDLMEMRSVAHPGDLAAAFAPAQKAARKGHPLAMVIVGNCYYQGEGVRSSEDKARSWNQRAYPGVKALAETGRSDAQFYCAYLLRSDLGVPPDERAAFAWLKKAAEAGEAVAWWHLGGCFEQGEGVTKDLAEARRCYEEGVKRKIPGAMIDLGRLESGQGGMPANPERAARLFEDAAVHGAGVGATMLSGLYQRGQGVPKDLVHAGKWLIIADALGDGGARIWFAATLKGKLSKPEQEDCERLAKEWLKARGKEI